MNALGRGNVHTYTLTSWVANRGLPVKYKKSISKAYRIVYLNDFWKWAEKNRKHVGFAKMPEGILGKEPSWVKEQRKSDELAAMYKKTPWTPEEDALLRSLLKTFKYSYRELSVRMQRTDGAIRRRMTDLGLKERPLREPPNSIWTQEQEQTVIDMYSKGHRTDVMAEYVGKSAHAIEGKIERLLRDGKVKFEKEQSC